MSSTQTEAATPGFFDRFPEAKDVSLQVLALARRLCEQGGDLLLKAADALAKTSTKLETAAVAPEAAPAE
jgi:hypothetical protein